MEKIPDNFEHQPSEEVVAAAESLGEYIDNIFKIEKITTQTNVEGIRISGRISNEELSELHQFILKNTKLFQNILFKANRDSNEICTIDISLNPVKSN